MTVLIYRLTHSYSAFWVTDIFLAMRTAGQTLGQRWVGRVLLVFISFAIAGSIGATYATFWEGMLIRENMKELLTREKEVAVIEHSVQKKEMNFTKDNEEVLGAMENISAIRYLLPETDGVAFAPSLSLPHEERP